MTTLTTLIYWPISRITQVSQHQNDSILDFIVAKSDRGVVTTGAIRMQNSSQTVTTTKSTPSFLQNRCNSCHPTNSVKALKEKSIIFYGLHHP